MTTLERSAYSFRRQGSSGHIWDNRPAGGEPPPTTTATVHGTEQNRRTSNVDANSVEMETNEKPCSRSESKPPRCSFIAIFGRCAKTPVS
ncbi:hypothetical protein RDI58_006406 [Solanum bulbocastanum]|uniref:Uncharacterized protein n=1 Tax=Solanum bulbocastanum TaxID=147425 RepID=A0AAN8YRV8_SOLBU